MGELSLVVAFLAGIVSFLSPCILPIIPGFLAYLAGSSLGDIKGKRLEIFLTSVFFVFGFSVVFSLLGVVLNTLLSQVAYSAQAWLARGGGVIIIVFGLYLTGLLKIPFLEREWRLPVKTKFSSRYVTAFLFGAAFAAGWSPCVGAVLGAILGLAASAPGSAFLLLFTYSLGLGIPFLLVGLFVSRATGFIQRSAKWFDLISKIFGYVLVVLGILAFTQNLSLVANLELLNRFLLK